MYSFWPQSIENRAALRTAIAVLIAVLISFKFHMQTPYWSGMTVVVITNLYTGSIIDKAMMRIIGTIAGAFLGFYVAGVVANSFLLYLVSCFLIITVSVYYYNFSTYSYAYLLGALCAFIVISQLAINPQNAFLVAIWRPVEIGIGVLISAISAYCIFPNHLKDNISVQVHELFDDLSIEFQQLLDCLQHDKLVFDEVSQSNLKLKKDVRKSIELIGAMRRELGVTSEQIDELSAILDSFYDFSRQLHYLIIALPQQNDLMAIRSLPLEAVIRAILFDLKQLQAAFLSHTTKPIVLLTTDALLDLEQNFKQKRVNKAVKSDFIFSLIHFLNQVNQRLIIMQSLMARAPVSIIPKFQVISRQERLRSDPDLIKHSIKAGLSVLLALGFWLVSNWPGGLNGIISSLIISIRKNLYDMTNVSIHRLVGCFLGGGIALLSLFLVEMNLFDFILVVFFSVWGFTYFMFKIPHYSYIGLQANIALIITLAQEGGPPVLLAPPLQRLGGIVIGIIASFIVANVLWRSDSLTVLNRYLNKLYLLLGYNLKQVLLVPGNQKSLHDLPNLFWISRGLIESLDEANLNAKKQAKLSKLTHKFESLVIIQATISHLLATIDKEQAEVTADLFGFNIKIYKKELITFYEQHDTTGALDLSQKFKKFLSEIEKTPHYSKVDDEELRNFLAYVNALIQIALRVQ